MNRIGYVYVLHFEKTLAHSRHYVGCTSDPRARLCAHAQGRGARIVKAAAAAGIGFRLAALGCTHHRGMRRIERQCKDWHNTAEFCPECNPNPRAIPGTQGYPIESIPWPLDSENLAHLEPEPHQEDIEVRLTSAADPAGLSEEIKQLQKPDKECLGFVPAGGDGGITSAIIHGRVAICRVFGKLAGYALFTEGTEQSPSIKIQQVCVDDVHRGCGIGRMLVDEIAEARHGKDLTCAVRDDLPANAFWEAIGFSLIAHDTHETSGHRLNRYRRESE
jgi:ribosomal protein S18 acetylase RimI-like enzyme/predicted GIY-YIG superfamily endonuclease